MPPYRDSRGARAFRRGPQLKTTCLGNPASPGHALPAFGRPPTTEQRPDRGGESSFATQNKDRTFSPFCQETIVRRPSNHPPGKWGARSRPQPAPPPRSKSKPAVESASGSTTASAAIWRRFQPRLERRVAAAICRSPTSNCMTFRTRGIVHEVVGVHAQPALKKGLRLPEPVKLPTAICKISEPDPLSGFLGPKRIDESAHTPPVFVPIFGSQQRWFFEQPLSIARDQRCYFSWNARHGLNATFSHSGSPLTW
jgi:hypothetical protein